GRSHPADFHRSNRSEAPIDFEGRPLSQMCRVGKCLPDLFGRVAQFSDENERPLLSLLSYLCSAGRARRVLLAIGHLTSPCFPSRWCRVIHPVQVAFECINVRRPEPTELSQPGINLLKWFRLQSIETALRVDSGFHETGFS